MILYYVLVTALPLTRHPFWTMFVGDLTMIKYLGLLCLPCGVFYLVQRRTQVSFFKAPQGKWFLLLVALSVLLSLMKGSTEHWSVGPVMVQLSLLVLFVLTVIFVDSLRRLRNVSFAAIGSMAFASLYVLREWQNAGYGASRPGWVVGDPNYFTLSALLFLPLSFYLYREVRGLAGVFCLGCAATTLLAVVVAASRGGFLGLLAALTLVGWRFRRRLGPALLAGMVILLLLLVLPSSPIDRLLDPHYSDVESQASRLEVWRLGIRAALDNPWTGVGPGNFKQAIRAYDADAAPDLVAHNTYIHLAAEIGFPGLGIFLGVLGATWISLGRVRAAAVREGQRFLQGAAEGMQAGLVGYAVSAFFISASGQKFLWLLVFLSICLASLVTVRAAARVTSQATLGDLLIGSRKLPTGQEGRA